jgi:hypothetical protein
MQKALGVLSESLHSHTYSEWGERENIRPVHAATIQVSIAATTHKKFF